MPITVRTDPATGKIFLRLPISAKALLEDATTLEFSRDVANKGDTEEGAELNFPPEFASLLGDGHTKAPPSRDEPAVKTITKVVSNPGGGYLSKSAKRKQREAAQGLLARKISSSVSQKSASNLQVKSTGFAVASLSFSKGSFTGINLNKKKRINVPRTKEGLLRQGYEEIAWTGADEIAVTDCDGLVIIVLVRTPDDPTWATAVAQLDTIVHDVHRRLLDLHRANGHPRATTLGTAGRRGPHDAYHAGVSFGGGQMLPATLSHTAEEEEIMRAIPESEAARRIAALANAGYAKHAPKLWKDSVEKLETLWQHAPSLARPFPKGVFPAYSVNFPPITSCRYHVDQGNRAVGWCAVFSGGDFDPDQGGHLVLPALKLFIRFPPGCTILLPSATLLHGNTLVAPGQSRWSFVQYCAGGLFRFVEYGLTTFRRLKETDPEKAQQFENAAPNRWVEQVKLLSIAAELHQDRVAAGLVKSEPHVNSTSASKSA